MIHVNIRRNEVDIERGVEYPSFMVETSTDGAEWRTQYLIFADDLVIEARRLIEQEDRAAECARMFSAGAQYAGAEVRITMFGYLVSNLYPSIDYSAQVGR